MANPKSTSSQSQNQTQNWVATRYQGEDSSLDLDADDDEIDSLDSEGIPTSTPDEHRLELDTSSDGDLADVELVQRANEEIIGDVDGDDYRAGTLDPDGMDRGLRVASSEIIEEDEDGRRNAVGPGMGDGDSEVGLGEDNGRGR
jgi:hypothetical protein